MIEQWENLQINFFKAPQIPLICKKNDLRSQIAEKSF